MKRREIKYRKETRGIHYPFSEDSWDKMEMLLNEDNILTWTSAPQGKHCKASSDQ